jgi:Epoxide hydrolase N terminus
MENQPRPSRRTIFLSSQVYRQVGPRNSSLLFLCSACWSSFLSSLNRSRICGYLESTPSSRHSLRRSPLWPYVGLPVALIAVAALIVLWIRRTLNARSLVDGRDVPVRDRDAHKLPGQLAAAGDGNTIRPFHISVPDEQLVDLRRRIAATRWPDRETVNDRSQGVQLAKFQEVVRYWGTDYDWCWTTSRCTG